MRGAQGRNVLTVFIATHNGAQTLPRVLAAHADLRAPAGGWQLVLIDNGSDDGSDAIAARYADRLPLHVVREPRRGKNRALNCGLALLAGDLAVFSDDDTLPAPDWLVALRRAADAQPQHDVFGGAILAHWDAPPPAWLRDWVDPKPVFAVSDPDWPSGPCEPARVWGPNMAIRAAWFARGYRFDERIGPNRSRTYAMGGETELTLRLALAEGVRCWHTAEARVHHIIRPRQMTRAFVLRRAFHLGRCLRREAVQRARAGQPHARRDAAAIGTGIARALTALAAARRSGDARRAFAARWDLNIWRGCLHEALRGRYEPPAPISDAHAA